MVHFYNGDKTEDYVTLVDSEVIPEAEIHNEELDQPRSKHQTIVEKTQCKENMIARTIKLLVVLSLGTTVAALGYRAYIQDNEIQTLKKIVDSEKDIWSKGKINGTSLCDFAISDLQYDQYRSRKIGDQKGSDCVAACLHMKEIDMWINGVTVYVDPAKKGCWCLRNMTNISKRYKSCFLNYNSTTNVRDSDNTSYTCKFKPGDGHGGTELMIGRQKGNACINACLHLKQFDNTVNGVTVFSDSSRGGCWCEKGMETVYKTTFYKTCHLLRADTYIDRFNGDVCKFSIGYANGGTKFSMGKRSGRQCVDDCLHMKGVDPSINGVTITPKEGDCWCDQGMKNISGKYKTCFLKPSYDMCAENNVSYHGNDIKNIGNVESWVNCSDLCRGLAKCNFWTWRESDRRCYLKSSKSGRASNLNAISGSRTCGERMCSFTIGSGASALRRKISDKTGSACVNDCLHMKKIHPSINGVTVYSDPTKGGCFCEYNMTRIGGTFRTCFLNPKTTQPLVDFNDTKPACELKPGDGFGVMDLYLGKLKRNACLNACLHMKKIDNTVNGITVYSNTSKPGCWCVKGMRSARVSTLFNSCVFKYNNTKSKTREFNGTTLCRFSNGSGNGGTKFYMGKQGEGECVDGCSHMRRIDPSINGITRNTITEGCWCEKDMKRIGEFKSCFLKI